MAASSSTRSTAIVPRFAPRMTPASMTPIDCAVIGTGMKPSMIGGSSPSATMMAAKRAERTRSRVLMALGLSGNWIAVVPADAARVNGGGDLVGGLQRLDDQRSEEHTSELQSLMRIS